LGVAGPTHNQGPAWERPIGNAPLVNDWSCDWHTGQPEEERQSLIVVDDQALMGR